jgi:hypothetical protein
MLSGKKKNGPRRNSWIFPPAGVAGLPGFVRNDFCFSSVLSDELRAVFPPAWILMTCAE